MAGSNRIVRVNELLKRELSNLINLKNIAPTNSILVSVTEVKTTSDLRKALVFISVFGGDDEIEKEVIQALRKKRVELQHDISLVITLKFTPVLRFELDKRLAAGDRIFELLGDVNDDGEE
ncbi:MAG: 30S ribosome-binding factor RbfA [Victivallales bacterium]|nr:30S ribosome-binding factor RbfA [Victivallales bacterium]